MFTQAETLLPPSCIFMDKRSNLLYFEEIYLTIDSETKFKHGTIKRNVYIY